MRKKEKKIGLISRVRKMCPGSIGATARVTFKCIPARNERETSAAAPRVVCEMSSPACDKIR